MIADDFYICGEGHALYEKSSVIQWYKLVSKIQNIIYKNQYEITHSGCKRIINLCNKM